MAGDRASRTLVAEGVRILPHAHCHATEISKASYASSAPFCGSKNRWNRKIVYFRSAGKFEISRANRRDVYSSLPHKKSSGEN